MYKIQHNQNHPSCKYPTFARLHEFQIRSRYDSAPYITPSSVMDHVFTASPYQWTDLPNTPGEMCCKTIPLQLTCVLKPIGITATIPKKAPHKFLPRSITSSTSSPSLLLVTCKEQRSRSCVAAMSKVRDDDTAPGEPPAPGKASNGGQEGKEASAEFSQQERAEDQSSRAVVRTDKNSAYELFAAIYVCVYVLSWRLGELIDYHVQEALEKFRKKR